MKAWSSNRHLSFPPSPFTFCLLFFPPSLSSFLLTLISFLIPSFPSSVPSYSFNLIQTETLLNLICFQIMENQESSLKASLSNCTLTQGRSFFLQGDWENWEKSRHSSFFSIQLKPETLFSACSAFPLILHLLSFSLYLGYLLSFLHFCSCA